MVHWTCARAAASRAAAVAQQAAADAANDLWQQQVEGRAVSTIQSRARVRLAKRKVAVLKAEHADHEERLAEERQKRINEMNDAHKKFQEEYEEDSGGLTLTDGQIRCMAGEMVAGLDDDVTDELLAGNTLDDPPPGAELVVLDSLFSCASVTQLMTDSMVADGATQAEAECFADGFDENLIRAMLTSELTGEDPSPEDEAALTAAAIEVMTTCDS